MKNLLNQVFDTSPYTTLAEKNRARMIYGINTLLMVMGVIFVLFLRIPTTGESLIQVATRTPAISFYIVSFYVLAIIGILVTRYGYAKYGGVLLIIMWSLSVNLSTVQNGAYNVSDGMTIVTVILLGGLLNGTRGLAFGLVIALATLVLAISLRTGEPSATVFDSRFNLFTSVMFLLALAGITYLFLRYARLQRTEGITLATQDRLKMAEIAAKLTQRVTERVSLSELLHDIVTQICVEFPEIYHAQVFLVDVRGESAQLAASTGTVGQKLIERHHNLGVGSLSVIGQVTFQGKAIVSESGAAGTVHRTNEFLPNTQSEAAFPMKIGHTIIGALDLQSQERTTFQPTLVDAFQALADNLALAIDNVQQFERAEARIQENLQLVEQTRTALREVERLNERLTGRAWSEYLRTRADEFGLHMDFESGEAQRESGWTNTMQEAVEFNHFVQEQKGDRQIVTIPLRVRGQVVGAMEFELDRQDVFTPEDLTLVQEVGERFGLAAENTRLVEESQRVAQREALVNEISSRLQAANNIETTLSEAARSIQNALKAHRVAIRLGNPPTTNGV